VEGPSGLSHELRDGGAGLGGGGNTVAPSPATMSRHALHMNDSVVASMSSDIRMNTIASTSGSFSPTTSIAPLLSFASSSLSSSSNSPLLNQALPHYTPIPFILGLSFSLS